MANFQGLYTITNVEKNCLVGVRETVTIIPNLDYAPVVQLDGPRDGKAIFLISYLEKTGTYIISEWGSFKERELGFHPEPLPSPHIAVVKNKGVYVQSNPLYPPQWIILKNVGTDNYMIIKDQDLDNETGEIHAHWELPSNQVKVQLKGGHSANEDLTLPAKFIQLGKDGTFHHGEGNGEALWKLTSVPWSAVSSGETPEP